MNGFIRQAAESDASRIGEILVFNNRVNYWPIFRDEAYSFGEMQVLSVAREYTEPERLNKVFVYDDGIVRGYLYVEADEVRNLYVDVFFQNRGVGDELLRFAIDRLRSRWLWVLEKNVRAIAFYERHGFRPTGEQTYEDGTTERLLKLAL